MKNQIDPTLIKGVDDGAFDRSLGLMPRGYFTSRENAAICVDELDEIDFRVVPIDDTQSAELFVKTADWIAWKKNKETSKASTAFKDYWHWFWIKLIAMPVMGLMLGALVAFYSYSGQLAHEGFLTNPKIAFWCVFGIVVISGWAKLAWDGIKIKLGNYSTG